MSHTNSPLYDTEGTRHEVVTFSSEEIVTSCSDGLFAVWDRKTGACLNAGCSDLYLEDWEVRRGEGRHLSEGLPTDFQVGATSAAADYIALAPARLQ